MEYGVDGDQFVPGVVRRHVNFWHDIILKRHPLRETLVLYLRDVVDLHDLLLREYRGPSSDCPYDVGRFPGAVFKTVSLQRSPFLWTTRYKPL